MDAISLLKGGNLMLPVLTDRENQVLKLIAYGFTNREISRDLSISESTVENHIHNIYTKLRISNRAQAVGYAFQLEIILLNDILNYRGNPS
jgi:DNA-binding NarL/FixJ family response regulator